MADLNIEFTDDKPTKAGFYFYRSDRRVTDVYRIRLLEVFIDKSDSLPAKIMATDVNGEEDESCLVDGLKGQFSGRL